MKAFLLLALLCALAVAALFMPVGGRSFLVRAHQRGIPAAIARAAAHALRSGWDALASLGDDGASRTTRRTGQPPKWAARKVQAAWGPVHRTSREGIVPQPPKEKLADSDRAALDALVAQSR